MGGSGSGKEESKLVKASRDRLVLLLIGIFDVTRSIAVKLGLKLYMA